MARPRFTETVSLANGGTVAVTDGAMTKLELAYGGFTVSVLLTRAEAKGLAARISDAADPLDLSAGTGPQVRPGTRSLVFLVSPNRPDRRFVGSNDATGLAHAGLHSCSPCSEEHWDALS